MRGEIRLGMLMPSPIVRHSPDGIGETSPGLLPTLFPMELGFVDQAQ